MLFGIINEVIIMYYQNCPIYIPRFRGRSIANPFCSSEWKYGFLYYINEKEKVALMGGVTWTGNHK